MGKVLGITQNAASLRWGRLRRSLEKPKAAGADGEGVGSAPTTPKTPKTPMTPKRKKSSVKSTPGSAATEPEDGASDESYSPIANRSKRNKRNAAAKAQNKISTAVKEERDSVDEFEGQYDQDLQEYQGYRDNEAAQAYGETQKHEGAQEFQEFQEHQCSQSHTDPQEPEGSEEYREYLEEDFKPPPEQSALQHHALVYEQSESLPRTPLKPRTPAQQYTPTQQHAIVHHEVPIQQRAAVHDNNFIIHEDTPVQQQTTVHLHTPVHQNNLFRNYAVQQQHLPVPELLPPVPTYQNMGAFSYGESAAPALRETPPEEKFDAQTDYQGFAVPQGYEQYANFYQGGRGMNGFHSFYQ